MWQAIKQFLGRKQKGILVTFTMSDAKWTCEKCGDFPNTKYCKHVRLAAAVREGIINELQRLDKEDGN